MDFRYFNIDFHTIIHSGGRKELENLDGSEGAGDANQDVINECMKGISCVGEQRFNVSQDGFKVDEEKCGGEGRPLADSSLHVIARDSMVVDQRSVLRVVVKKFGSLDELSGGSQIFQQLPHVAVEYGVKGFIKVNVVHV